MMIHNFYDIAGAETLGGQVASENGIGVEFKGHGRWIGNLLLLGPRCSDQQAPLPQLLQQRDLFPKRHSCEFGSVGTLAFEDLFHPVAHGVSSVRKR